MYNENFLVENYETDKNIIEECRKKILWYKNRDKKEFSIVYFHGFGATLMETYGFPERVAELLQANCFLTRLKYHGIENNYNLLKNAKYEEWLLDIQEGINICQKLGEKIIIIAHSFSTVLVMDYLSKSNLNKNIFLVIFTSPALVFNTPFNFLINKFCGLFILKLLLGGNERILKINDKSIEKYWSIKQPVEAILQLALITNQLNPKKSNFKYNFVSIYYNKDKVINIKKTLKFLYKIKNQNLKIIYSYPKAKRHTFTGKLLQPETIDDLSNYIFQIVKSLLK